MGHSISSLSQGGVVQPGEPQAVPPSSPARGDGESGGAAADSQKRLGEADARNGDQSGGGDGDDDDEKGEEHHGAGPGESAAAEEDGEAGGGGGEEEDEQQQQQEEEEEEELDPEESADTVSELPKLDVPDRFRNRQRRFSVSAESDREPGEEVQLRVVPKTPETLRRIQEVAVKSILFQGMEPEQQRVIFDAMEEVRLAAGEKVIRQGDEGDYWYVIDSGKFEVFSRGPDGTESLIWSYDGAGSFGELALMYNSPRSATVVAATAGTLWRVDRQTFRAVLVAHNARQRKRFEDFLSKISLFANLSARQRASFADVLVPTVYEAGRRVVVEGEPGDLFFIVEKGRAKVTVRREVDGAVQEVVIDHIGEGGCFGERALIVNEPRSASVWAETDLTVAAMGRSAYERLIDQVYIN